MKKQLLFIGFLLIGSSLMAQWEPVNITGSSADVTSMFCFGEDLMAGTAGDGVFMTADGGSSWTDISGDLANLSVNDVRGGGGPTIIWVSTEDGAYYTQDHQSYLNCTDPALSNNNINYFWFGSDNASAEWAIGTFGAGVFISPELTGPWTATNSGLSGDALKINDMAGYSDDKDDVVVLGTEAGVYISTDNMASWTAKNNGLSGAALQVNRVAVLGTAVFAATDGGYYSSFDLGETWTATISGEQFNTMLIQPSPSGIFCIVAGENAYHSLDLVTFTQLDLAGLSGEISSVALNSTYVFLGTTSSGKDEKKSGGVYRKPADQLLTGVPEAMNGLKSGSISQNLPNPCSNSTTINFSIAQPGEVSIHVTDLTGRKLLKATRGFRPAGDGYIKLDISGLKTGIYYYSLLIDGQLLQTRKMLIHN